MGSTSGDPDEKPVHLVKVKTFGLAQTEVTVAQYKRCVAAGKCTRPYTGMYCNWGHAGRGSHPVNCVEWKQAAAYSRWAGGRLPSEVEWEYAARGGGLARKYSWGNEKPTCDRAILKDGGWGCGKGRTWPVCSKPKGNTTGV